MSWKQIARAWEQGATLPGNHKRGKAATPIRLSTGEWTTYLDLVTDPRNIYELSFSTLRRRYLEDGVTDPDWLFADADQYRMRNKP